jgi:hypothetical protein
MYEGQELNIRLKEKKTKYFMKSGLLMKMRAKEVKQRKRSKRGFQESNLDAI